MITNQYDHVVYAAQYGHIKILEWLIPVSTTVHVCTSACRICKINLLNYILDRSRKPLAGIPVPICSFVTQPEDADYEILEYVLKEKWQWNEETCKYIAEKGSLATLE